jgi:integrase
MMKKSAYHSIGSSNNKQRQQWQNFQNQEQSPRIYPVTEGVESNQTKIVYQRLFNHFLDYVKIHDLQVLLDFSPKVIKQMIVDYVLWLRDEKPGKKLSRTSIKVHLAAILHFFQINNDDFNLTIKNFRIHLPSVDDSIYDNDRPYTVEEIAQVLKDCDPRGKAVILLLCSTGMRIGALPGLQKRHLTEVEFQGKIKLYKIQVYMGTRDKYYTFCTPECYQAIQDYWDFRRRCGEKLNDRSPLIREQFNKDNPFTTESPRFISPRAIEYLVDNVLQKSGVRRPGVVHMSHGFRKLFMTQCEKSGLKSINVKMLLGHDIGVSGHYYRPAESDLLEDYMIHAADALTISSELRLKQENQDLKLEQAQEITRLKAHLEEREEKDREISEEWQALKKEMDELRKFVFPGPVPQDKQMRKTYLKVAKSYYKDEKGIDIDQC